MTHCRESGNEAAKPINLRTPKSTSIHGTWNVRTMYQSSKAAIIANEMKQYNIEILGLSETRWISTGKTMLATGETILYSVHQEDGSPHTEGVAMMMSKEANRALISWEPISSRIITATFRTKHKRIRANFIQCYAPTNNADENDKDNFYNTFNGIIIQQKDKDLTVLMGDFNAKIGNSNMGYEQSMGNHGLGQMNENGEQFAEICANNKFVIGGSIFPHKRIHKATWVSPDHVTENQIDHFCISNKFRRSFQDVCVKRGADAASDHHLLIGKIRMKLRKVYTMKHSSRVKYNVNFLREKTEKE
ncbi:craniofacial development protein 2-like [Mytilus edulis]|uniref:craniofacial development protein 2-like n=1 Tax=Mytilus edulis TaxID=6550 RepID=UPI0039EF76D9